MPEDELIPEGTPLEPTETAESALTLEAVHAMVLELQGQIANLQATADQATPVEPNAEEPEEAPGDESLLEEEPVEAAPDEDIDELDKVLQEN